jgi:hypothetical protein
MDDSEGPSSAETKRPASCIQRHAKTEIREETDVSRSGARLKAEIDP